MMMIIMVIIVLIVQFSALVEKVEVDLLNKDDDNYKREVLHSVKVFRFLWYLSFDKISLRDHAPVLVTQLTQLTQLIHATSDHR